MDANKRLKLVEIDYTLEACGVCAHSSFSSREAEFGTCGLHQYDHQKHSGPVRDLSVHRCGRCPDFTPDAIDMHHLHAFTEFLP